MRLVVMRLIALLLGLTAGLDAQTTTRVPFQCSEDDLQTIGLACSDNEPCPVFVELSTIEAAGPRLFITGNLHTEATTLSSILLMSEDGGATWKEPHGRIRYAGLEQIQFVDPEYGWISGQSLQGVPKDPFLLMTQDGGKTWRAGPIYEEGRTGMIEQFWFDSRTSGSLVIDRMRSEQGDARHELYETMTGGDSWSLRQASASPIPMKRRTVPNGDWRIRTDAVSKSYRLERREGARWTPVALFPVRAGECKTKEPVLAEPPPPEEPKAETEKPAEDEPLPAFKKPRTPPTLQKKRPGNQ